MCDELIKCCDCIHYEPGNYYGPAMCKNRNKKIAPAWVYNKLHKCPVNAFEPNNKGYTKKEYRIVNV
jgi:hypothetical protein